MDYEKYIFYERDIHSVTANTRADGRELLAQAAEIPKGPPPKLGKSLFDQMHPLPELKSQRPQTKGQDR